LDLGRYAIVVDRLQRTFRAFFVCRQPFEVERLLCAALFPKDTARALFALLFMDMYHSLLAIIFLTISIRLFIEIESVAMKKMAWKSQKILDSSIVKQNRLIEHINKDDF
jgi:hypothetical protein